MLSGFLGYVIAAVIGGLIVGVIANRRPQWFRAGVEIVNKIDDKANAAVATVKDQINQ